MAIRTFVFNPAIFFALLIGFCAHASAQTRGYLQVNVLNAEAAVYVDGRYAGTASPSQALNIMEGYPVGTVRVTVEATGYESQSSVYAISENAWTQAVFQLEPKQTTAVPPAAPPPPGDWQPPTATRSERMLKRCRAHMRNKALSTPPGNNALECFQQVLEQQPANAEALQGLSKIESIYEGWVRSNLRRDRLNRAQTYLRRLMTVNPDSPSAWALQKQLDEKTQARAEQERLEQQASAPPAVAPAGPAAIPTIPTPAPTERSLPAAQPVAAPSLTQYAPMTQPGSTADLVRLPSGCFTMGSPFSEVGRDMDESPHEVCVDGFEIALKETTVREFARFVAATGYRTDAEKDLGQSSGCYSEGPNQGWMYVIGRTWRDPGFYQTPEEPVVCVSWNDARAYIDWHNQQTGQRHRLPTEAEWEYAARAGSQSARHWGESADQACRFANVADQDSFEKYPAFVPHECKDGYVTTAPVGSYQPNGFGLFDILGNASEWVCSYYQQEYGRAESRCARDGRGGLRANRGGAWMTKPDWVRSAVRARLRPNGRADSIGFRLAGD